MSATLYQNELTSLASESKRRFPDIRTAADKALQDLKAITVTSEQQLAADLRRRPDFVDAFLKACLTLNAKLAISGVNALQRLVISQALPRSRLDETLQAFNACAELGLDVQLKVLQALPSLVQNYSEELRDKLLGSVLQVCAALQGAKVSTISAVAAATLQQIVASVFARVTEEDQRANSVGTVASVPGEDGNEDVRPAAYDAYRVFRDLALASEGRSTQFVQLSTLSKEECLELIASCIEAKPQLVNTHGELSRVIRTSVVSLATSCLTDQQSFTITVRSIRILRLLTLWFFTKFQAELEPAISLFTHTMEADSSSMWKKVLIMELLRDIFAENGLVIKLFVAFDQAQGGNAVIQDVLAAFVRLSAEKPALIGLGQLSTVPNTPTTSRDTSAEQFVADTVTGVTSMLSSFGVIDSAQGISSSWSVPKSPCYEQLDKSQPPTLPETYIYSLVLDCLNGLSDTLAKIVLPLTMQQKQATASDEVAIKGVTELIETCWPAVLATCSTFMNAALDDGYYRALIKAYQRFAQVAGLLRLDTPRDALMTTLGKAAVPPQVLSAAMSEPIRTPVQESSRVFSNSKNLLSIESLVSQTSSTSDKDRRSSLEQVKPVLTVRNLLCLRALLNLAIALGPTLEHAFTVVVQVLKQADIVLSSSLPQLSRTNTNSSQQSEYPSAVQSFSAEIAAVEAAASRLLESTADYPDDAFTMILHAFGGMLHQQGSAITPSIPEESSTLTPTSPMSRQRSFSGLPGIMTTETKSKALQFALPKLGTLAALNVSRFVSTDVESSGWEYLTSEVTTIATSNTAPANARRLAVDLLCRLAAETIFEVAEQDDRNITQDRSLALLLQIVIGIYEEDGRLTNSDLEVQSHVINSVKIILEQSGDTIIAGWDKIMAILSSAFESDRGIATKSSETTVEIQWTQLGHEFVSLRLGRDTFGTLQLLITDFFSQLPTRSTASVIELLYRFMSQGEDLNLSLTAITVVWNVSDQLFKTDEEALPLPEIKTEAESERFESDLTESAQASAPAQWILLLVRLRQVVQRAEREPAKAAFQTLCSIAKNTGSQLPLDRWAIVLRHIIIGVLADEAACPTWQDRALTSILLDGSAETISQQIHLIGRLPRLLETWESLDSILVKIFQRQDFGVYTATYQALAAILSQVEESSQVWQDAATRTFTTWSILNPSRFEHTSDSNQHALRAYTRVASQLLRLKRKHLTASHAVALATNLAACISKSGATVYSADAQTLSPLQIEVMTVLREIPQDIKGIIPKLVDVAADFIVLHKLDETNPSQSNRPSYVALSADAMIWLEQLVTTHIADKQLVDSGALEHAVTSLAQVIEEKYRFQVEHKGRWLWMRATEIALTLAPVILHGLDEAEHNARVQIWRQYLRIACAIIKADGLVSFHNNDRTFEDEEVDVSASKKLAQILLPQLGGSIVSDGDIQTYNIALFDASIVHPLESSEKAAIVQSPLDSVDQIRRGRVKKAISSRREDMSYECLSQLIILSSRNESNDSQARLAQSAAPLLIARLAIPLRAYIADQPLRGRMPQQLSEVEELLHCLEQIKSLSLMKGAVPVNSSLLPSQYAHLTYLRPLLLKALKVAGDQWCGSREVFEPLQNLLEDLIAL